MTVLPFRTEDEMHEAIPAVRRHLDRGGILAYPTETVYGLGSRAVEADVEALAGLKGRPKGKPFLLLVASRQMAESWGLVLNTAAAAMAAAFWPGPLTLVLPGAEGQMPDSLRGREGGIAVRWTSHKGMAKMIAALGYPITSTSANRPGQPPAPGVGAILDAFADEVRAGTLLVLDGGVLGNVPSSTLVDCTGPIPKLIREGAIPRAELQAQVGSLAP
jgi:L-threonylcarbamoyladenylate synthase